MWENCHDQEAYEIAVALEKATRASGLRSDLVRRIEGELDRAYTKHGRAPWGRHEFYAILLEEVEEVWDVIKRDMPESEIEKELVQVAAMCFRHYETRRAPR